ncbi:MAG TPA: lamin tail domain-containing protein [Candidatus Limnocylindria bacterium]|nr:lamin tail domain-containing protein [Candidatus Limnocylindria bacterium]
MSLPNPRAWHIFAWVTVFWAMAFAVRAASAPDLSSAADSVVTFNEVMYRPPGDPAAGEWLEVYNAMSIDIDLSGWRVEGGVQYQFPRNTVLLANQYLVVAADPAALRQAVSRANIVGPFAGRLSNSGDRLVLRNRSGRLMDELTYGEETPWPPGANGSGGSLAKREKYAASSPAENWQVSVQTGGTPGTENFPSSTDIPLMVDTFLDVTSPGRWKVPEATETSLEWTHPSFNDASWNAGTASLGFDEKGASLVPLADRAYGLDGDPTDSSGHGIHGSLQGGLFSTNVPPPIARGQSLLFDGQSTEVRVPDTVNPLQYTIACWVEVEEVRACSLIVRTDGWGPDRDWSHQLRINANGHFEHYLYDGGEHTVTALETITPGVWYHVAGTAISGGPMRLYVNGKATGGTVAVGSLWSGGDQWRFGTDSGHTPHFFHGRLDEVGIWMTALRVDQIQLLAGGIGLSSLGGYAPLIRTDLKDAMFGRHSSFRVRLPFLVAPNSAYSALGLQVRYDDGYVAFLNGTELARRNAPDTLTGDSTALVKRTRSEAIAVDHLDLSSMVGLLRPGTNVLAVQGLNVSSNDVNVLLTLALAGTEAPPPKVADVSFSEIGPGGGRDFFIEIMNRAASPVNLAGYRLSTSNGKEFVFGSFSVAAKSYGLLRTNELGFAVMPGTRLFLSGPQGAIVDAAETTDRLQGRLIGDSAPTWFSPSEPTPGGVNTFEFRNEVVINEIMYHAPVRYTTNDPPQAFVQEEQWVELYNRSDHVVDLSGWQVTGLIGYRFPLGTALPPDGYLVIARDASALRARYPNIVVMGNFEGKLSHRGGSVVLRDAAGNPANEVTYYSGSPWPEAADGGGSSLELIDPRADNAKPEAWAASLESAKSGWQHYSYEASAVTPRYTPNTAFFREFRLGLLKAGEVLVDNVSVLELNPAGANRELIQNSSFESGTANWRLLGNHRRTHAEADPVDPSNGVLDLFATGPCSYLSDRVETTLNADGAYVAVAAGRRYRISFDARWLSGSPQLHTELYYNKVAHTTILPVPELLGTPGQRNSTLVTNSGPTFAHLGYAPVMPNGGETIDVNVDVNDPDGVQQVRLYYSVNGAGWVTVSMNTTVPGFSTYRGTLPAQLGGAVIQYYAEARDRLGATSVYPSAGPNSRALIKVEPTRFLGDKQSFRIVMTARDAATLHDPLNMMSDEPLGCTIIHNESEVFYDAHIHLHGSMFSRNDPATTGFSIDFPADHLFRGTRGSVVVRRSDLVQVLGKHILNQVGGLPGNYDDVIYLLSHRSDNVGNATLNLANYDDTYVKSQFEGDDNGTLYKMEGIREYVATDNGSPEGNKLSQPIGWIQSFDLADFGNDKEQYRWGVLISNQRARDDYAPIIAMGKAFGQTDPVKLKAAVAAAIDVDEWARYFAIQMLAGVGDIYGVDNPHNICFYARPSDGRVVVLQNDWGYLFAQDSSSSIYGGQNVFKVLNRPGFKRLYLGHLLDLINSDYNGAYLQRWVQHFNLVAGYNYNYALTYVDARVAAVRRQLPANVPFTITSQGGVDFTTNAASVTLDGQGWINVRRISLGGQTNGLSVEWLDDQHWRTVIPLAPGTNVLHLVAYDLQDQLVGEDTIAVTSTALDNAQRQFLRISELMYYPTNASVAEVSAGFNNNDDFEFVELINTGTNRLSLLGVRFNTGITFDFSSGSITNLEAGARLIIAGKKSAFDFRYGTGLPVTGSFSGHLSNEGELLRLIDAYGNVIEEMTYGTSLPWPVEAAGEGSSLERVDAARNANDPMNWRASRFSAPTPGLSPATDATFSGVAYGGNGLHLKFMAEAGKSYTVYRADSLANPHWVFVARFSPVAPGTPSEVVVPLANESASDQFYRLVSP